MEFDAYDAELHRDPYPTYRRRRDEFPVHHNPHLRFWTLSRHDDVLGALKAPDLFLSGKGVVVAVPEYDDGRLGAGIPLLITTDRPRHTQLRALVSRAFTPRRVARLEPRIRARSRARSSTTSRDDPSSIWCAISRDPADDRDRRAARRSRRGAGVVQGDVQRRGPVRGALSLPVAPG